QRGLAQARRTEDQHVVQRLAAGAGSLDVDAQLLADRLLAEVFVQSLRPDRGFQGLVLAGGAGAEDAAVFVHAAIMAVAGRACRDSWRPGRARASDLDLRAQFDQAVAGDAEEAGGRRRVAV